MFRSVFPRRTLCKAALGAAALVALGVAQADVLADVQKRGVIRVAIPQDFPPFGSLGTDLKLQGYDIDMANLVGKELGVKVEMVPVTSTVVFFSTTILRAEMEPEMCWSVLILQTPLHRKSPEALPYKTRSRHSMFSPFRSALACTVTLPQVCTFVLCVLLCRMTSSSLM